MPERREPVLDQFSSGLQTLVPSKQEEVWQLHTPHLHQPEHSVAVDLAEMVDDGFSVVDHGCAALPPKVLGSQPGSGMVGAEKGAASGEGHAYRSAPGESGPTQGDADWHEPRVERDDRTGAGSEQQRMDPVSALERLSIPTQRLQNAIQRMSRRQSGATPSPDHCLRLQARQCVEAGKGVGAICRTSRPVLGPSGSRNGWRGRNHPAFTTRASRRSHARLGASHSSSFDQRLRPEAFLTAMATALGWPTSTTSCLPRVTPV